MLTTLISFTLVAFTAAIWKLLAVLDKKCEPVKKSYPSAVNKKLAMDYDQIKSL